MKRIALILSVLLFGTASFGWLRVREKSSAAMIDNFQAEQATLKQQSEESRTEQRTIRKTMASAAKEPPVSPNNPFSPGLAAWLASGDFSNLPKPLVPELRDRLGLSDNVDRDFVLVSKPTMETLRPSSPRQDDKLSDSLCALLSIDPEQKTQIELSLTRARQEFAEWARKTIQRTGPNDETLVSYSLPADDAFANSLTNRLLSKVSDLTGTERAALFRTYSESWFQIEMGYLGGVTNTLSVFRMPVSDGQSILAYKLSRTGPFSSMSQNGEINADYFPPAWKNIFPGGWQELAQREGFSLPKENK